MTQPSDDEWAVMTHLERDAFFDSENPTLFAIKDWIVWYDRLDAHLDAAT